LLYVIMASQGWASQGWASSCAGGAMAMRRGDVRGSWPWRGVGHSDGLRSIGG
jgi:hypothetical protein